MMRQKIGTNTNEKFTQNRGYDQHYNDLQRMGLPTHEQKVSAGPKTIDYNPTFPLLSFQNQQQLPVPLPNAVPVNKQQTTKIYKTGEKFTSKGRSILDKFSIGENNTRQTGKERSFGIAQKNTQNRHAPLYNLPPQTSSNIQIE